MSEGGGKKTGCLGTIVVVLLIGAVFNMCTGSVGSGVKSPKWDGSMAYIEVDDYVFNENSDPDWWKFCEQLIQAAKKDKTESIYMRLKVTWVDKYGDEEKVKYDIRMDDPKVRSIAEIKKYKSGDDLFDSLGMGFMAAYTLGKTSDNIVIKSSKNKKSKEESISKDENFVISSDIVGDWYEPDNEGVCNIDADGNIDFFGQGSGKIIDDHNMAMHVDDMEIKGSYVFSKDNLTFIVNDEPFTVYRNN